MAPRAGAVESSTSPIGLRSSERSIRASWTTGYWGAAASIRASMSTRFVTTAATIRRASAPAAGSASTSARSRSRTAVAVRCPKSDSNTEDSATRRPARRERTRSDDRSPSRVMRDFWFTDEAGLVITSADDWALFLVGASHSITGGDECRWLISLIDRWAPGSLIRRPVSTGRNRAGATAHRRGLTPGLHRLLYGAAAASFTRRPGRR